MFSIRRLGTVLVILALAALVSNAQQVDPPKQLPAQEPLPEGVIAIVNGEPIAEKDWVETLKRVAGRGVLEVMIRHKVIRQAAAQQGISLSEKELTAFFDKAVADAKGLQNLQAQLQRMGESVEDFKARLHAETLLRMMAEKSVTVTDDEVQKFFLEKYGRKAEVQAIVVATKQTAEVVLSQLKTGSDFAQMAAAVSTDQTTKSNHGYIPMPVSEGFFPKPMGSMMMTELIAEQIFKLKEGQITGVLPGANQDFYIFRLAKSIPAQEVKFESIKEEIRRDALQYKTRMQAGQMLQGFRSAAKIRLGI